MIGPVSIEFLLVPLADFLLFNTLKHNRFETTIKSQQIMYEDAMRSAKQSNVDGTS